MFTVFHRYDHRSITLTIVEMNLANFESLPLFLFLFICTLCIVLLRSYSLQSSRALTRIMVFYWKIRFGYQKRT